MGHNAARWTLLLVMFVALSGRAGAVVAVEIPEKAEHHLVGLGLHQETGRNIYLGGIYLDQDTPRPSSLTQLSRPWTMEYRIIARRTSIRSLLGGMLLQSEVATGSSPDSATADFADSILSTVKTPLYAGDSLTIRLDSKGNTTAVLNGHELARVPDAAAANYLLQGWIGKTGSSTIFRADLLAGEVNSSLLATLTGNTCSTERKAQVAAWFEPTVPADEPASADQIDSVPDTAAVATAAADEPTPLQALSEVAEISDVGAEVAGVFDEVPETPTPIDTAVVTTPAVQASPRAEQILSRADEIANTEPGTVTSGAEVATALLEPEGLTATTGEAIQVASLTPVSSFLQPFSGSEPLLGVQEYSRRLSLFHGSVVAMVYKKIRYPTRAVRRNLQGRVELDVTIRRSGELLAVAVAQSSGHDMLDSAAVKAAEGAFSAGLSESIDPVAVAEFGGDADTLVVPIPVSFKLTE